MPSMSLYAAYLKEREDFQIVIREHGFATYRLLGEECYIRDIYTVPAARMANVANDMADEVTEIAKAAGCKYLSGTVSVLANNCTASTLVLAHYGFTLVGVRDNTLLYKKDI